MLLHLHQFLRLHTHQNLDGSKLQKIRKISHFRADHVVIPALIVHLKAVFIGYIKLHTVIQDRCHRQCFQESQHLLGLVKIHAGFKQHLARFRIHDPSAVVGHQNALMILQAQNIPLLKKAGRGPCRGQSQPNSLLLRCHQGSLCFFRDDLLIVIQRAIQIHGNQFIFHLLPHQPRNSLQHRQVDRVENIEKVFEIRLAPLTVVQKQQRDCQQGIMLNASQIRT